MSTQIQISNEENEQHSDQMTPEISKCDTPQALPKTAEAEIASGLKRLYGEMLAEPIPDKFASLLAELAKVDRKPEQPT